MNLKSIGNSIANAAGQAQGQVEKATAKVAETAQKGAGAAEQNAAGSQDKFEKAGKIGKASLFGAKEGAEAGAASGYQAGLDANQGPIGGVMAAGIGAIAGGAAGGVRAGEVKAEGGSMKEARHEARVAGDISGGAAAFGAATGSPFGLPESVADYQQYKHEKTTGRRTRTTTTRIGRHAGMAVIRMRAEAVRGWLWRTAAWVRSLRPATIL